MSKKQPDMFDDQAGIELMEEPQAEVEVLPEKAKAILPETENVGKSEPECSPTEAAILPETEVVGKIDGEDDNTLVDIGRDAVPPTDVVKKGENSSQPITNPIELADTYILGEGTVQKVLREHLTPKPYGKYNLAKTVGRGGMKTIFKVKDHDTVRNIAMAVITEGSEVTDNDLARFIKEARITANLEHPNIVPVHDIGIDEDGNPYFTMKLIEGETLADIVIGLRDNTEGYAEKYTLSQLLQIFQKVCNAIDFAHSKGVIHLDLKPGNIEIGDFGDVLVLDWGLAKHIEEDGRETYDEFYSHDLETLKDIAESQDMGQTIDGEVKGTPGYMAPEQAAGLIEEKGKLTDVYSLGAILYNILTLKKPIDCENVYDLLDKTIDGDLIPPSSRRPDRFIPRALEAITMKAMSVCPDDRYQSVRELLADIDAFISGFATVAEEAGVLRQINLFIKRNKALAFVASFAVIVSVGLAGFWMTNELKQYAAWGKAFDITPLTTKSLEEDWVAQAGNWAIGQGQIAATKGRGDSFRLFYNKEVHGNIALEFDAMVESDSHLNKSGDLSIIFSGDKKGAKGYYLQLGGVSNSSAVIQKNRGLLASKKFRLEAGRVYHIRAEKEGEQLRLFCDGDLIISARDIFYREGGYVGLYTFGEGKKFWNIKLYSKGVPELVSPLDRGDGFYRESRARSGESKREFLNLARKAYSLVYESYPEKQVGLQALLKRSYVDLELGNIITAQVGAVKLGEKAPSLDQILLKAELDFRSDQYENAYNSFKFAVTKYPSQSVGTVGVLMTKLADREAIQKIDGELLMRFWRMYAENQTNSILRCSNKFLTSLKFLQKMDFNLIDCSHNFITSLEPLRGMNLTQLDCADNDIESLEPLRGMKLESFECFNNPRLVNLDPLRKMPLKVLALNGCTGIRDLSALLECPTLERLCIPRGIKGIEILKKLPKLKYLSYDWEDRNRTAEQFWAEYESR